MIVDHVFRKSGGGSSNTANTGSQGGIAYGMCAFHGTCNRPREEHVAPADFHSADQPATVRRAACYCCGRRVSPLDSDQRCGHCGPNRSAFTHVGDLPCRVSGSYSPGVDQ